jgi:oligopeptide/dipeptide ABC transporter ATP-binding protein
VRPIVETRELRTHFPILRGILRKQVGAVKAVDGVNLAVAPGQWMGLVGESGCGKTTLGKTMLRLLRPTSGHILFGVPDGTEGAVGEGGELTEMERRHDLAPLPGGRLKAVRRDMQLVHQDPYTSLNPRMKVGDIIGEPIAVHRMMPRKEAMEKVAELVELVGLTERHLRRYPHEFSGGQRQRIAIARTLSSNPRFIVFDEPTSALDVSVQAQILQLLAELKATHELTYLYITHNLTVAENVCDRIAVMYLGKLVEVGDPTELFNSPRHPYSQALVLSTPIPDPTRKRGRLNLPGEVPSPANPPPGCRFHPRCSRATDVCSAQEPLLESAGAGHLVACWHPLN